MSLVDDVTAGNSFNGNENDEASLKNCYRLVILGDPRVGKTCIINWFLAKAMNDGYIPTIEDFHRKIFKIKGEIYRLDILDTSGNDPFPAMKKLNIMTGDLFVLVFSLDHVESFYQIKNLIQMISELKRIKHECRSNSNRRNVPILILGNKLDLILDHKVSAKCVEPAEVQEHIQSFKSCIYAEVSCKKLIGLDQAFENLFTSANLPVEMVPSKHRRVSLNLDLTKPQFSKHCEINESTSNSSAYLNVRPVNREGGTVRFKENSSNSLKINCEREGSLRASAKKSFRKMTFRRHISEACGTVWLNARRPSIRAELKLLKIKSKGNFLYHTDANIKESSLRKLFNNLKSLFCCHGRMEKANTICDSKKI